MKSFKEEKRKDAEPNSRTNYPSITVNKELQKNYGSEFTNEVSRVASTERMTIQRAAKTSMGVRTSIDDHTMNPSSNFLNENMIVPNISPYSILSEKEMENTLTNRVNHRSSEVNRKGDGRSSSAISMRDITPEIAAQVVKNYLLPMFDSDSKQRGKHKGSFLRKEEVNIDTKPKTIYGELKLSDQLISQIDELK